MRVMVRDGERVTSTKLKEKQKLTYYSKASLFLRVQFNILIQIKTEYICNTHIIETDEKKNIEILEQWRGMLVMVLGGTFHKTYCAVSLGKFFN